VWLLYTVQLAAWNVVESRNDGLQCTPGDSGVRHCDCGETLTDGVVNVFLQYGLGRQINGKVTERIVW
jgi:hypothetical protein